MITTTLDQITLNDVTDLENAPYVIEGEGDGTLRIYFDSEENNTHEYKYRTATGARNRDEHPRPHL